MKILSVTFLLLFLVSPKVVFAQLAKFSEPTFTTPISLLCGYKIQYIEFTGGVEEDKGGKKLRYYYKVKNVSSCRAIVQWDFWVSIAFRVSSNLLLLVPGEEKTLEYLDVRDPKQGGASVWIWVEQPTSSHYASDLVKNEIVVPPAGFFMKYSGGLWDGYFPTDVRPQ